MKGYDELLTYIIQGKRGPKKANLEGINHIIQTGKNCARKGAALTTRVFNIKNYGKDI